ncbi:ShlB/FhaC/HecB family hemolysin secretion/activation protein [Sulfurospirillum halorespirans]|uniref:Hemolysin activation/secretion protein n=1 Tax=Sulfurospirillum halorespirans DSM 13726 TaxID=1193502 RepID=A0A1D7TKS5_9BACT|nr:ShlB/FhaC/HecB family hemolysin secretion/activation protein [Sulfurospirillum halorespirans]AOO65591.1 hemolysin activation/secretion protein [Sulfurospirillum halorespirans DSM 13726]
MAFRIQFLLVLLCLLGNKYAIFADSITDAINQREQFEKQKEVFEKLDKRQDENIMRYNVEKPELLPKQDEQCFQIKSISDEGITLLSHDEKQALYDNYRGKCNSLTDLSNLARELTALYLEKGYITSQVYIKPQNISSGEVTLYAVEGKVAQIVPDELYINSAFMGQKDDYLNLRDLENAVETINRLPSNHAKMDLIPSSEVGYTDVSIENNTTNRINGSIGINNFGTKKTGDKQGSLALNVDNPLGINDQFVVNLNSTDKHFQNENSIGDGYEYSFPIGGLLTTLSYRKSSYEQYVYGGINQYDSNGDTKTYTLALNYKLFHNESHRVSIGSSVSQYQTKNYLSESLIETASYDLSKVGAMIDYMYQTADFYTYVALNYTQGTDWFDATNPTSLNEKYSLYTIDASLVKRLDAFQYSLSGHYQHSNYQLFSTNQISIGGHYSVRGFQKEGLSGNTGYYVRNEFSYTPQSKFLEYFDPTYFIALDGGEIKKEEDTNGGKLLSDAVGLKLKQGNFDMNFYYAMPLYKKDVRVTQNFFGASANYRF